MTYRIWLPFVPRGWRRPHPKRGVGATRGGCPEPTDEKNLRLLNVSWAFVWGPRTATYKSIEMVSMIRDERQIGSAVRSGSQYLLGFNEPDEIEPFGCDMDSAQGAVLWREVEELYGDDYKLISPATVGDRCWLRRMADEYRGRYGHWPKFDALSMHCYNPGDWIGDCQRGVEMLAEWGNLWGVPEGIWVNEYANPWASGEEQINGMRQMLDWLDNDDRVDRHAWFAARYDNQAWAPGWNTQLLECDRAELTELGKVYAA